MLPITVNTEPGEVLSPLTAEQLAGLIGRLGGEGDRFAVAERTGGGADHYIQTWHEGDGPYEVEYRDGSPERHFGARMSSAEEVTAVFVAWAGQAEGWAGGHAWQRVELSEDAPGESADDLDPELLEEAEEQARLLIRCGFDTPDEVAEDVSDYFHDEGVTPVSPAAARRIVERLWQEQLAEQANWPQVTDVDRLETAFAALGAAGITARMHFTCCSKCGLEEIRDEAAEGDRGFVFFHYQHTERAAEGHGLWLLYGGYEGGTAGAEDGAEDGGATAAVGREIVTALTEAGLTAEWDGDPDRAICVAPLVWRKRVQPL
ncbi:hypothetical protein LKL35_17310 [Streptomyces sp. ET3-23]|uniref:DUF6891 domain-containing protein n=1 Tax=Streptomyces sp. ET3-23 TaxID=2885643 RepID=UPI001D12832B|nr:hypothetical protein [Streptomyces sp. ET3-23]MCC2277161.1 hypothetical protein [Streptomyces sp. ET3-23]